MTNESRNALGTTARLERAQNNSVVATALFASAILILALNQRFSNTTLLAAQIFLLARIIYLPADALPATSPIIRFNSPGISSYAIHMEFICKSYSQFQP